MNLYFKIFSHCIGILIFLPKAQALVSDYQVVHLDCKSTREIIVLRRFLNDQILTYFAVDPTTLETILLPAKTLACNKETTEIPHLTNSRYEKLLQIIPTTALVLQNEGLERDVLTSKVFLSFDLCPSHKAFEPELFDFLKTVRAKGYDRAFPIGISLSGTWMTAHQTELKELQNLESSGAIKVTWINHTRHHPYVPLLSNAHNFLLEKGVDPRKEILDQEILMIEQNILPSIFMRFPGLITDEDQLKLVQALGLIPVGANAWIAKTRTFNVGDVILIHGNGNEPAGIRIFFDFIKGKWLDFNWSRLEDW